MKKKLLSLIAIVGAIGTLTSAQAESRQFCSFDETLYLTPHSEKNRELTSTIPRTTILAYEVSKTKGGDKVGESLVRRTSLGIHDTKPGPHGIYEQANTIFLPKGNIVVFGMADFDVESHGAKFERAIIGGTGIYSGITGSFVVEHLSNHQYKITPNAVVPCR